MSANLGLHVGDDPGAVHIRRAGIARRLGRPIVWMNQTHSARVVVVGPGDSGPVLRSEPQVVSPIWGPPVLLGEGASAGAVALEELGVGQLGPISADGVIIDARHWDEAPAVAVMVADCLPVLMASADGRVVAAVHAGRVGLAQGIVSSALRRMVELVGRAELIHVAIGPAICGSCYEVESELRDEVVRSHPAAYSQTSWGTPSLDLKAGARQELEGLGVAQVYVDPRCTFESEDLYSHRRDPRAGRQVGVIRPA